MLLLMGEVDVLKESLMLVWLKGLLERWNCAGL